VATGRSHSRRTTEANLETSSRSCIGRQQRIARFGVRREKLSDLQLALQDEEASVTADEVSAEAEREALPETGAPSGRGYAPTGACETSGLPAAARALGAARRDDCRPGEKRSVVAAPQPDRMVEKGLASDRVVVDTVIQKYCAHLRLYRQEVILRRETGLPGWRSTGRQWMVG